MEPIETLGPRSVQLLCDLHGVAAVGIRDDASEGILHEQRRVVDDRQRITAWPHDPDAAVVLPEPVLRAQADSLEYGRQPLRLFQVDAIAVAIHIVARQDAAVHRGVGWHELCLCRRVIHAPFVFLFLDSRKGSHPERHRLRKKRPRAEPQQMLPDRTILGDLEPCRDGLHDVAPEDELDGLLLRDRRIDRDAPDAGRMEDDFLRIVEVFAIEPYLHRLAAAGAAGNRVFDDMLCRRCRAREQDGRSDPLRHASHAMIPFTIFPPRTMSIGRSPGAISRLSESMPSWW